MASLERRIEAIEKLLAVVLESNPFGGTASHVQPAAERLIEVLRAEGVKTQHLTKEETRAVLHELAETALFRSLRYSLEGIVAEARADERAVYPYLAAQSLGLDLRDVALPRFIPVRMFLDTDDRSLASSAQSALREVAERIGFEGARGQVIESGSYFARWWARSEEVLSRPEVLARLEKVERAAELHVLHGPQSGSDEKQAHAVQMLMESITNVPRAALQVGSVVIVKTTDSRGVPTVVVRTLTQRQMILVERDESLLRDPESLLKMLTEHSAGPMPIEGDSAADHAPGRLPTRVLPHEERDAGPQRMSGEPGK